MKVIYLLFLIFFSNSCKNEFKIDSFNNKAWGLDKMACNNSRSSLADSILLHKDSWLGIDDDDIVTLLGRPERSYYYERNVRAFGYYLTNGKQCDSTLSNFGKILVVEFNATGFSKRIYFETE